MPILLKANIERTAQYMMSSSNQANLANLAELAISVRRNRACRWGIPLGQSRARDVTDADGHIVRWLAVLTTDIEDVQDQAMPRADLPTFINGVLMSRRPSPRRNRSRTIRERHLFGRQWIC